MEKQVHVFSEAFCPTNISDHFTISVSESFWREIMRDHQEGRSFLRIRIDEKVWIAPVGHPISDDTEIESLRVYLPLWMIDSAGFEGLGEVATCELFDQEAFPPATKLSLKVVDSAFYTSEVKEELELALTQIGVVQKHSVLQIPIQSLSGFRVEVFLATTEPADIVLCEGDEVVVEFEEPVDYYEPPAPTQTQTQTQTQQEQQQRPPTPIPELPPFLLPPVSFPGEGRTLGSSTAEIPEWRRNLPCPRPRYNNREP